MKPLMPLIKYQYTNVTKVFSTLIAKTFLKVSCDFSKTFVSLISWISGLLNYCHSIWNRIPHFLWQFWELITTLDVCIIGEGAVNDVLISLYNTVKLRAAHLFVPSDFDCGRVWIHATGQRHRKFRIIWHVTNETACGLWSYDRQVTGGGFCVPRGHPDIHRGVGRTWCRSESSSSPRLRVGFVVKRVDASFSCVPWCAL